MLFLHGYLSSKESFYYQINFLGGRGFKAVAPDILGFGSSSPLSYAYSVGDYAVWLKKFILAEGLEGADIVAHSFGARVAIKLLSGEGGLSNRLVITGGAGLVKERSPQYMRRVKLYRAVKKIAPRFAERHFGSEEYKSLPPLYKQSYKKIVNEDLRACAGNIKNRTLLIYGASDSVTPYGEEGETFHALIEDSRLVKIDGGHFCFSENPEAFNKILMDFLSEN